MFDVLDKPTLAACPLQGRSDSPIYAKQVAQSCLSPFSLKRRITIILFISYERGTVIVCPKRLVGTFQNE
jgi:hypothetical protein